MILFTAEGRVALALEPPRAEYRYNAAVGDVAPMQTLIGYQEGTLTFFVREVRGLAASLTFSHDVRYRVRVEIEPVEGSLDER